MNRRTPKYSTRGLKSAKNTICFLSSTKSTLRLLKRLWGKNSGTTWLLTDGKSPRSMDWRIGSIGSTNATRLTKTGKKMGKGTRQWGSNQGTSRHYSTCGSITERFTMSASCTTPRLFGKSILLKKLSSQSSLRLSNWNSSEKLINERLTIWSCFRMIKSWVNATMWFRFKVNLTRLKRWYMLGLPVSRILRRNSFMAQFSWVQNNPNHP